ncbi:MAG: hypothetical protein ABI317_17015 [Gaiellales bacterium]
MGWREQRVGENESRFRLVNERIRDHAIDEADRRAEHADQLDVLCECADIDCTDRIALPLSQYEWVRSAAARFVVVPGHDLPMSERVVRDMKTYVVVEKFGDARAAASELDPRNN